MRGPNLCLMGAPEGKNSILEAAGEKDRLLPRYNGETQQMSAEEQRRPDHSGMTLQGAKESELLAECSVTSLS